MADLYADLIIYGRRTFESVPNRLKPAVEEALKRKGYDTDGKKLKP